MLLPLPVTSSSPLTDGYSKRGKHETRQCLPFLSRQRSCPQVKGPLACSNSVPPPPYVHQGLLRFLEPIQLGQVYGQCLRRGTQQVKLNHTCSDLIPSSGYSKLWGHRKVFKAGKRDTVNHTRLRRAAANAGPRALKAGERQLHCYQLQDCSGNYPSCLGYG